MRLRGGPGDSGSGTTSGPDPDDLDAAEDEFAAGAARSRRLSAPTGAGEGGASSLSPVARGGGRGGLATSRSPGVRSLGPPGSPPTGPGGGDPFGRPSGGNRRNPLVLVASGAAAIVVIGIVVLLVLANSGTNPITDSPQAADASKPPLAKLCPPPSAQASAPPAPGKAPSGSRISDPEAGITYVEPSQGPWQPWDQVWSGGTLGVKFAHGFSFVTEPDYNGTGSDYLASVLSGSVPATANDGLDLDLKCTGSQVAEDVRKSFYPKVNDKTMIKDEAETVGGRPAWEQRFHLAFSQPGLRAKGEYVSVVLIDVGKPTAAVLYLSLPDTHRQYRDQFDQIIASVKVT